MQRCGRLKYPLQNWFNYKVVLRAHTDLFQLHATRHIKLWEKEQEAHGVQFPPRILGEAGTPRFGFMSTKKEFGEKGSRPESGPQAHSRSRPEDPVGAPRLDRLRLHRILQGKVYRQTAAVCSH